VYQKCLLIVTLTADSEPFRPPFTYQYTCSSTILSAYIPIYVISYCLLIVLPLLTHYILANYTSFFSLPAWIRRSVPGVLWPDDWRDSQGGDEVVVNELNKEGAQRSPPPPVRASLYQLDPMSIPASLININSVVSKIMQHIAVLLTFGLCSPVLGTVISLAIFSSLARWRVIISRFTASRNGIVAPKETPLSPVIRRSSVTSVMSEMNSENLSISSVSSAPMFQDIMMDALETALYDVSNRFYQMMWIVVWISAIFFACITWDIAGDEVGWVRSLWAPLIQFSIPTMIWLLGNRDLYTSKIILRFGRNSDRHERKSDSSTGVGLSDVRVMSTAT
jgi:hypothetical protein